MSPSRLFAGLIPDCRISDHFLTHFSGKVCDNQSKICLQLLNRLALIVLNLIFQKTSQKNILGSHTIFRAYTIRGHAMQHLHCFSRCIRCRSVWLRTVSECHILHLLKCSFSVEVLPLEWAQCVSGSGCHPSAPWPPKKLPYNQAHVNPTRLLTFLVYHAEQNSYTHIASATALDLFAVYRH